MSDYVYLENLNGQQIKPVTDLAAINMTTTNGIGVSTVNGGTIGIIDGYIESAYYTEMADPAVGAANVSSAYVDGGTAVAILGAYTVASAVDTAAPSQQKVPSEKAVVDALNNVVVSGVSYYAGTGINIDQGHTVSVANVPQSSVAGLETTLTGINTAVAAKQDAISAGYRMSLDGTTLNQKRYFDIESPTSATITLQAGHAYKITATNSSKTLDSEQIPANQFGLEGHAEIFVAGTGLIKTTSNVVLAQALEPDAVNNCTVRFHDGFAIISVEDHVAGYIVISASGTTAGTLPYALSTASNEYISFDASLNNMTLDMGGAVTNGKKHVVGNGFAETVLTGEITCTGKTTFTNLAMNGVAILGGTMTLGDVHIPNGATVSVSGGGLAIERVTGAGTVNLGGTHVVANNCNVFGVIVTGGSYNWNGGAFSASAGKLVLDGCTVSGNSATGSNRYGGGINVESAASFELNHALITGNSGVTFGGGVALVNVFAGKMLDIRGSTIAGNSASYGGGIIIYTAACSIESSTISGNTARTGKDIYVTMNGTANVFDSVIGDVVLGNGTTITFGGTNTVTNIAGKSGSSGSVVISSGASIALTSSIAPGGTSRITVLTGGCVVNGNAIAAGTYTSINSNGTPT